MELRFVRPRTVPAIDLRPEGARDRPWLRGAPIDDVDRRHIVDEVFLRAYPSLDRESVLDGDAAFFDTWCGGEAECPIEGWDVEDEGGRLLFRLWLWNADCGALVEVATARRAGRVNQNTFYETEADPGCTYPGISALLRRARDEIKQRYPTSLLTHVEF